MCLYLRDSRFRLFRMPSCLDCFRFFCGCCLKKNQEKNDNDGLVKKVPEQTPAHPKGSANLTFAITNESVSSDLTFNSSRLLGSG